MVSQSNDGQQNVHTASTTSASGDFKQLLQTEVRVKPDADFLTSLTVKDYQALYDQAAGDLEGFWNAIAQEFSWETPWTKVMEGQAPETRWFVGGRLNITTNCLDRHALGSHANKTALLWVGEDGEER